jgi:hypothetical protein
MKFTWGDEVKVKADAPEKYRPNEFGAVVGITEINNDVLSNYTNLPLGTITYTVEYIDGTDQLIPEECLELDVDLI